MSQTNTNREKKIRSILERSSSIDAQNLQKYINKKLTKEELHELEKQLLNSDFAAEAVEGFANADFKVDIVASTRELNLEIKKYNKERGFYKRDYRIFYATASVALLFVVLFSLFGGLERDEFTEQDAFDISSAKQNAEKAQENARNSLALSGEKEFDDETEEKLIEELKDEEIIEVIEVRANKNSTNLTLNRDRARTKQDFSTSDIWIQKQEKVENRNNGMTSSNSSEQVVSSPILSERQMKHDSSVAINTDQLADDDYNFSSDKNKMNGNQKSAKETLFIAMQSYENKKYTEASLLFDSYLVTNPNDAQSLYFSGLSHYENHDYKKAIPLLEKFSKQESSMVYQKNNQDAEWYLAISYLKINQKAKAETILQKIADSSHKYSNQAKVLLKK
jgi:cytochrome c-type biogenesis protein CcmH/NrfG